MKKRIPVEIDDGNFLAVQKAQQNLVQLNYRLFCPLPEC
jgi:hypothetical protein